MYTTHGHQIIGTTAEGDKPATVARCGGPGLCNTCSREAEAARREQLNVGIDNVEELKPEGAPEPPKKAVMVFAFDESENARLILARVKAEFDGETNVRIWAGVNDVAQAVIEIFEPLETARKEAEASPNN